MDVVGNLIGMSDPKGSIDLRCQMSGDCFVDHETSPPGEAVFHVVLNGSVSVEIAGRAPAVADAGCLIFLPHGSAHKLRNVRRTSLPARLQRTPGLYADGVFASETPGQEDARPELDLLCGRFNYDALIGKILLEGMPDVMCLHPDIGTSELGSITSIIRQEAETVHAGAAGIVTALTTVLFILALRESLNLPEMDKGILSLLSDRSLAPAVVAVYQNPSRQWTVEMLAHEVSMSRATFARRFARRSDIGPIETVLAIRSQLALHMLRETTRSVADIAHAVGYSCEISFGKAFSRQVGITPANARRRYQAQRIQVC